MTSTEVILAPHRNTVRPQVGTGPVAVRAARLADWLTRVEGVPADPADPRVGPRTDGPGVIVGFIPGLSHYPTHRRECPPVSP